MLTSVLLAAVLGQVPGAYVEVPIVAPQPPTVVTEAQPPLIIPQPPIVRLQPQPPTVVQQQFLVPLYTTPGYFLSPSLRLYSPPRTRVYKFKYRERIW